MGGGDEPAGVADGTWGVLGGYVDVRNNIQSPNPRGNRPVRIIVFIIVLYITGDGIKPECARGKLVYRRRRHGGIGVHKILCDVYGCARAWCAVF